MESKPMIIDYQHPAYQMKYRAMYGSIGKYNGAYYYSKEIRELLIPKIKTDRNWVTINIPGFAADHSIVFIHNNVDSAERYGWLSKYKDLVLVVGVPETASKVAHLGKTVYLPLPIDEANVAQYKRPHDRDVAYAGRGKKFIGKKVEGDPICDLPREEMLEKMSHYKRIYAVGRTAIEAKILGAEILPYDPRFPSPDVWEVFTYDDAVKLLQEKLDEIDGRPLDEIDSK